jgi:hypothetical protein
MQPPTTFVKPEPGSTAPRITREKNTSSEPVGKSLLDTVTL